MKLSGRTLVSLYLGIPFLLSIGLLLQECGERIPPVRNDAYSGERALLVPDRDYSPLAARIMAGARKSIYLSLFRIHDERHLPDASTNQLLWELVCAARRGVSVNVKLNNEDSMPQDHFKESLFIGDLLKREGVKFSFDSKKRFLHSKMLVVDGNLSLVDSRNWTAWSLDYIHELGILVQSTSLAEQLISYWKSIETDPPPEHEVNLPPTIEEALGKKKNIWQTLPPMSEWPWVEDCSCSMAEDRRYLPRILALIGGARSSIFIGQHVLNYRDKTDSMYAILDALREAKERGVQINILIENYTPYGAPTNSNRESMELLRSWSIKAIPDSDKKSMHCKFLVIDDRYSIIGSTNWCPSSIDRTHELSLIIDSEEIGRQTREYWNSILGEK